MRVSKQVQKALVGTSLALLIAVVSILKLPQLVLSYAESSISTLPRDAVAQQTQTTQPKVFPTDFNMGNVKTVYGAKGDGVTDDTAAIQNALDDGRSIGQDYYGRPKAIYFPAGTYLVNDTLDWIGC